MPRYTGYATARVRPRSALIEPRNGRSVVSKAKNRTRGEKLIERQRAVKNITANQAKFPFKVER